MSARLPTFFISHGGGPWPWIDEMRRMFAGLARWLAELPQQLPEAPKAVLVATAHWEEPEFTVGTGDHPPMLYDYYGFPPHTYQIQYPAPGSPAVAGRVKDLLTAAGIAVRTDAVRGFDHGTFVPLALIYPQANVPVVQLSLKNTLDAAEHLRLGAALAPLRDEGVLIIGSGLSYHNMRGFRGGGGGTDAKAFEQWLTQAVTLPDAAARQRELSGWERAPGARGSHPREDHLIPLMVATGAAGNDPARRDQVEEFMDLISASYRFG